MHADLLRLPARPIHPTELLQEQPILYLTLQRVLEYHARCGRPIASQLLYISSWHLVLLARPSGYQQFHSSVQHFHTWHEILSNVSWDEMIFIESNCRLQTGKVSFIKQITRVWPPNDVRIWYLPERALDVQSYWPWQKLVLSFFEQITWVGTAYDVRFGCRNIFATRTGLDRRANVFVTDENGTGSSSSRKS